MYDDKWITVDKRTKKLLIRFRVKGYEKQFFIATGLKDTNRNREKVRSRRDAILTDIELGRFDATLDSYRFTSKPVTHEISEKKDISLLEVWDKFTEYQSTQIEQTTILNRYKGVRNFIYNSPFQSIDDAVAIRDYLIQTTTQKTAWIYIGYYIQACNWAVNNKLLEINPFEKLKLKRPKTTNKLKAFTLEQRDLIIDSFETSNDYSHYSNIIKFLFWTGCRPGEAFALTWDDISQDCREININKSCNFGKILKGTKNNKSRIFSIANGGKLQDLLLSMPRGKGVIFTTKYRKPITSQSMQFAWKGGLGRNGYKFGVVGWLADMGKIPYLRIYSTRHTFATWAIANGATPDRVAYWIGDNLDTVLKYYVHPEIVQGECPDF